MVKILPKFSELAVADVLSSLPGLTRQSTVFAKLCRRMMDARIKSGHDDQASRYLT
jgi:hypothetical protein